MKKLLVAGASAAVLAAMPVAATFAVGDGGSIADKIQTKVTETCTFTRQTTAHGATGTWDPTGTAADILAAATITLGSEQTLGSSNFNVVCNDTDGYQVTVNAANLALPSGTTQNHAWNYAAAKPTGDVTASYWRLESTGDNVDLMKNIVSTKNSAEDSKDFEITYFAYGISTQDAGTYSADVTYTFAQLPTGN